MCQVPRILSIAIILCAGGPLLSQEISEASHKTLERLKSEWRHEIDQERIESGFDKAEELISYARELIDASQKSSDPSKRSELLVDLEAVLAWVADTLEDEEDEAAYDVRQEVIELLESRVAFENEQRTLKLTEEEKRSLASAKEFEAKGTQLFNERDFTGAVAEFEKAWQIVEGVLGKSHTRALAIMAWLPYLHEKNGKLPQAIDWVEQELEILESTFGFNIKTAKCLHRLGMLQQQQGEYCKARLLFEESLDIRFRVSGYEHRDAAIAHTAFGLNCLWSGEYADAKPHLEQRLSIAEELPANSDALAACCQNLALYHAMTGDLTRAEPLYLRALTLAQESPLTCAHIHDNVGLLYADLQDQAKAEEHFQSALAALGQIDSKLLGPLLNNTTSPNSAEKSYKHLVESALPQRRVELNKLSIIQNNFARLYWTKGEFDRAEQLFERSLLITQMLDGGHRPETAACIDNLGRLHESMGMYTVALQEYERALAIREEILGQQHIESAVSKRNLGLLKFTMGDTEASRPLLRACLDVRRELLDQTACVQNERQQLQMNQNLRIALDDWLSVVNDESVYADVLNWKGAVFMRQAALRALRQQPDLKPLVEALRSKSSQFAKLSLTAPPDEQQHNKQLLKLSEEREEIETQLVELSEDYRTSIRRAKLSPRDLQNFIGQLQATALVDFFKYDRIKSGGTGADSGKRETVFVAFVLTGQGSVQRIELGPADLINQLVDDYRQHSLQNPLGYDAAISGTAIELRKVVWEPIEEFLEGVETVLISPDGSLGKLPFAALPGKETNTYLIEDYASAVIPVPQALPLLLSDAKLPDVDGNVLVVGGVDYDSVAQVKKPKRRFGRRSSSRSSSSDTPSRNAVTSYSTRLMQYAFLPATQSELTNIRETYTDIFAEEGISELAAAAATEAAFCKQAPKNRYLHIATHGFFAPEELVSAFATHSNRSRGDASRSAMSGQDFIGHNPGLLSGLVLAGANIPQTNGGDDGVLTALEVAELDLAGVELAVLSACETGLGRVAGGEGLLGLQRSFQIAGARSVIASLWAVNDLKTSALMKDFYYARWDKDFGKLEALRSAQLSMLNGDSVRGVRIKKLEEETNSKRTPPFFWAAFVLSGDWRLEASY